MSSLDSQHELSQQKIIKGLQRSKAGLRRGVVTGVSPLEVSVGGGSSVPAFAVDGCELSVSDQVVLVQQPGMLVVLGRLTDDPQDAGGGGITYSAGDGLDLSGSTFSTDLKSGGGLKIDATELAADFGTGSGKVTEGNDSRLSDARTPTAHVHAQSDVTNLTTELAAKAPLASPTFTGDPKAPTPSTSDNDTSVATTAHVKAQPLSAFALPAANIPMNTKKLTGLAQGNTAGDSAEYSQMIAGDVASQMGFQMKPAVYAASIAALPAHSRSGNVLTATANGFLSPSFGTLKFSWASGSTGTGNGQFSTPYDMALDSSGNIFVLDRGNSRVQKFNSSGVYQSQFGAVGTGNGQFTNAAGIAIDSTDRIYVIDRTRVQRFTSAGAYSTTLITLPDVSIFTDYGGLGMSLDSSGNVYIVWQSKSGAFASNDHRVAKYNSSGVVQWTVGGVAGSGNSEFNLPGAVAADSSGNVFVADSGNHRVQKFNSSGTYQSQFGTNGSGDGQFKAPNGIEIDSSNNIWVSDYFNARVQKFNSSGTYQSQYGGPGPGNGQFIGPRGIVVTSGGDLIVADAVNNRFQKFIAFTLTAGQGVLVRHEGGGTHIENNLYTVTNAGSAGTQWVLTLRSDADTGFVKCQNMVIAQVENATENRVFTLTTSDPITVWTTPLTWSRFEPGGPPTPHASNHQPGGTDPIPTGTPVAVGGANAEGTALTLARSDHVHDKAPVLGVHTLTSSFTTTGTHTTFQDEGLTKSITYLANRLLKVTLKVNPNPSGGAPNLVRYQVLRGSTVVGMWQGRQENSGVVSQTYVAYIETPGTGGTETFKVQVLATPNNTAVQSYADGSFTRQLIVEDLGPK